jgi:hypothetical protein
MDKSFTNLHKGKIYSEWLELYRICLFIECCSITVTLARATMVPLHLFAQAPQESFLHPLLTYFHLLGRVSSIKLSPSNGVSLEQH